MSEGHPISDRWLQFSVPTIVLLVALIVVSAIAAREYRQRKRLESQLNELGSKTSQQGTHQKSKAKAKAKAKHFLQKHGDKKQPSEPVPQSDPVE